MRISQLTSEGSALMRLMSAVPRDVSAKSRSSSTTFGRWRVMRSSALSASASENITVSVSSSRSFSEAMCSAEAMRTVADTDRVYPKIKMHNAQCSMHNEFGSVHSAPCSVHRAPCSVHRAPCSVGRAVCTMQRHGHDLAHGFRILHGQVVSCAPLHLCTFAPCTLHVALCIVHFEPQSH